MVGSSGATLAAGVGDGVPVGLPELEPDPEEVPDPGEVGVPAAEAVVAREAENVGDPDPLGPLDIVGLDVGEAEPEGAAVPVIEADTVSPAVALGGVDTDPVGVLV